MKKIFLSILCLFSLSCFSKDVLEGKFFRDCNSLGNYSLEYGIGYYKDGEEFEAGVVRKKHKRKCAGQELFAIGRIWSYEVKGNELISILSKSRVVLFTNDFIEEFNRNKFCGKDNWVVDEPVDCLGLDFYGLEEREGYRTIHQFKLTPNLFETIASDGDIRKLKPLKGE
jgi:hypothetical protein